MNAAILYPNKISQQIKNLIDNFINPTLNLVGKTKINIAAYVSGGGVNNPDIFEDTAVINLNQFRALYYKKIIDALILPRENLIGQLMLLAWIKPFNINFNDVYLTKRLSNKGFAIEPYLSAKYLPYLEFHIADQCNLNCKACEHYSALVNKPKFPIYEEFEKDMEQLHKFIDDIGRIRILGGEPLLNPEINKYIILARKFYTQSDIVVVTNAILLPNMPKDFFETLRQQNVGIHISFYPPLESKMESIKNLLDSEAIRYRVEDEPAEFFTCKQTLKKHNQPLEIFMQCFQAHCNNLYEGKIASCFLPFTTKYFNSYFQKNLPEDGAIDLYDENLTTEILKERLLTPFERCCYCTRPVNVKWQTVKFPSVLSDWVNEI